MSSIGVVGQSRSVVRLDAEPIDQLARKTVGSRRYWVKFKMILELVSQELAYVVDVVAGVQSREKWSHETLILVNRRPKSFVVDADWIPAIHKTLSGGGPADSRVVPANGHADRSSRAWLSLLFVAPSKAPSSRRN